MSLQIVAATLADTGNDAGNPLTQKVSVDCAALILTGTGILGAAASNAIIVLVLRLIGFAAAGVVKGSFAAWWQSTMPLVSAGSIFAKLTSIAMSAGGAGAAGTTIGGVVGVSGGAAALTWTPLANICKRVDEEVAQGSVAGATLQANTKAVQALLSSADNVGKTAKEVYDTAPLPVKAAAEQVGESINKALAASAEAAGYAYDAVASKAVDAAEAAKPALDKAAQAVADAAEAAKPALDKAARAVADAAEAAKPALDKAARATAGAAASSADVMSKAQDAVASKVAEAAAAAKPVVNDKIKEVSEAAKHFFDGLPRWLRSRL